MTFRAVSFTQERASVVKLSRIAASTAVASLLAVSMSMGLAAPAQAASLIPNGWNPKQLMINVLGSMLSGAGGDSPAKRAVIAADQTFDHSWEGFEESYKAKVAAGTPDTYQQYALQAQEKFDAEGLTSTPGDVNHPNSKKYVPKSTMPATRAAKLRKVVGGPGGALVALTAFQYRAEMATGVSNMLGIDAQGVVCEDPIFGGANPVNWLTGQDCDAYRFDKSEFLANTDLALTQPGVFYCITAGTSPACYTFHPGVVRGDGYTFLKYSVDVLFTGAGRNGASFLGRTDAGSAWRAIPLSSATGPGTTCAGGADGSAYCFIFNTYGGGGPDLAPFNEYCPEGVSLTCAGPVSVPVAAPAADPQRVFECEITGADGQVYRASSDQFTEGSDSAAPIVCPSMPSDVVPTNVAVKESGPQGPVTLSDTPTTPEFQDFYAKYPQCRDGACKLDLKQKKLDRQSCFQDATAGAACLGWFTDPLREEDYQCTYGGEDVALSECFVYSQVFKPDAVSAGQAYADPLTGLPVTGQSSPNAATGSLNRLATNPRDFSGCLDKGWGVANPVEWVMVPVTCSMQASFIPRSGFVDGELTKVALTWANTGPAKLAAAIGAWRIAPNVAGCSSSMNFPVPMIGRSITVPIIQACPGTPFGDFAPFVRALVTAVLIITAGFACKRIVGGWVS